MPADAMIAILGTSLLVTAAILARLPVARCAECPHCAAAQLAREREVEATAGRLYGIPQCQACGRYDAREDPHRRS